MYGSGSSSDGRNASTYIYNRYSSLLLESCLMTQSIDGYARLKGSSVRGAFVAANL